MVTEINDSLQSFNRIFAPFASSDKPGLVVGVALQGKVIYANGFGLASIEHGVINTTATRMRIGSTSKHFTALALLLLEEEGKLKLDDSVGKYLPEVKSDATLRQLMSHTGGIRCYLDTGFIADGMAIKPLGEALAAEVRQSEINFRPGARMIYCNGGYQLLSLVIERVAGVPFEKFLETRIFQPLGMTHTSSVPSDFEIHPGVATLHIPLADGSYRRGIFPSEEVRGEGAMISTIADMLIWLAHLRGDKKVGSDASWRQMLTKARLKDGEELEYCLGLVRSDYRGVEVIHHAGGVIGGSCQLLTAPALALDIIIMTNGALANPVALAYQIMDELFGDDVLKAPPKNYDPHEYAHLSGRYQARKSGLLFELAETAGKIGLGVMGMPAVPMELVGDKLEILFSASGMGPYRIALAGLSTDEPAQSLAFYDCGEADVLERITTPPPTALEIATELIGAYFCSDLLSPASIRLVDTYLTLDIGGRFGGNHLALEPVTSDLLSFLADLSVQPLQGTLRIERDAHKVTGFRLNTPRSRNLYFERLGSSRSPTG